VKDCIIILKEKMSTVENYVTGTQSILMKMINILSFIVEYLRKNDRTVDAEVVKTAEDE